MTIEALPATTAAASEETHQYRFKSDRGAKVRGYLGLVLIVLWGLAPFYWMIVTAFRDVGYTFDTTPWPTHVTLDNFRTAFSTDLGNHLARALVNSVIIGICTTAIA